MKHLCVLLSVLLITGILLSASSSAEGVAENVASAGYTSQDEDDAEDCELEQKGA